MQLDDVEKACIVNVCQPGSNLLAAGYCMYSSSTIMVLSVGDGVYGFTLDPMYGEFVMTHDNIKIPKSGKIYSFNEGNYMMWSDKLKSYIDSLKVPSITILLHTCPCILDPKIMHILHILPSWSLSGTQTRHSS